MKQLCLLLVLLLAGHVGFGQVKAHFPGFAYDVGNIFSRRIYVKLDGDGRITNALPPQFRKIDHISIQFSPNARLAPEADYTASLNKRLAVFYNLFVDDASSQKTKLIRSYFHLLLNAKRLIDQCPSASKESEIYKAAKLLEKNIQDNTSMFSPWILSLISCSEYTLALSDFKSSEIERRDASSITQSLKDVQKKREADSISLLGLIDRIKNLDKPTPQFTKQLLDSVDRLKTDWQSQLNIMRELQEKLDAYNIATGINPECNSELCRCSAVEAALQEVSSFEQSLRDVSFKQKLVRNLYCCDSSLSKYYVPAYLSSTAYEAPDGLRQFSGRFMPMLSTTSFTAAPTSKKNRIRSIYDADKESLDLQITINNDNLTKIIDWHNQTIGLLNRDELSKIKEAITAEPDAMDKDLQPLLFKSAQPECKDLPALKKWLDKLHAYDCYFTPTSSIGTWLKRWIWYSGGDIKLNYFDVTSPTFVDEIAKKEAQDLTKEKQYKEYMRLINWNLWFLRKNDSLFSRFDFYNKERENATDKFGLNDPGKKKKAELLKDYKQFTTVTQYIHRIQLPLSEPDSRNFILFHDRNHFYRRTITQKAILPESFKESFGIVNGEKDDKIAIDQKFSFFNDSGTFRSQLIATTGALQNAATGLVPAGLTSLLSNFFGTTPSAFQPNPKTFDQVNIQTVSWTGESGSRPPVLITDLDRLRNSANEVAALLSQAHKAEVQKTVDKRCPAGNAACEALLSELRYEYWQFLLLRKMLNDYFKLPTPEKIDLPTEYQPKDEDFLYNTYVLPAEDSTVPYTNTYRITDESSKKTPSRKYFVGKERIVTLSTGIFINRHSARQVYVDTAGQAFKITNKDDAAKFVLGFQIHPTRTFSADDGLLPRFLLKRLSLFGGFEVLNPLDNLYAGLAYDVVPGVSINYGAHYYKYDIYKVANGQIIDQSSKYKTSGSYFGVSMDPTMVLSLFKLLFK